MNSCEKKPIPASIANLLKMEHGDEKFRIGAYTFNTIKVVGVVASVQVDQDETCITYELNDIAQEGVKMARNFTVIRYQGVESNPMNDTFREGTYVQAVGKLRSFNNRLSLISFHIHEVQNVDELELFQLEAKIAYLYYSKKVPERNAIQAESIGVPFFACHAPMKNPAASVTPVRGIQYAVAPVTPVSIAGRRLYQQEPVYTRGLSGQQARIYDYVRRFGVGEMGVSLSEIQVAINGNDNLLSDIDALVNKYILYSTIDAEHFAIID